MSAQKLSGKKNLDQKLIYVEWKYQLASCIVVKEDQMAR
jgi:hypothetical protein